MSFTDFLGAELNVGDEVVFISRGYRDFSRGTVVSFTPQKVRIAHIHRNIPDYAKLLLQDPYQLIKVPIQTK